MVTEALQLSSTVNASLWARHIQSPRVITEASLHDLRAHLVTRRTAGSTRDGLYRVPSWSDGNGSAELFVRMDLGVDFGGSAWW